MESSPQKRKMPLILVTVGIFTFAEFGKRVIAESGLLKDAVVSILLGTILFFISYILLRFVGAFRVRQSKDFSAGSDSRQSDFGLSVGVEAVIYVALLLFAYSNLGQLLNQYSNKSFGSMIGVIDPVIGSVILFLVSASLVRMNDLGKVRSELSLEFPEALIFVRYTAIGVLALIVLNAIQIQFSTIFQVPDTVPKNLGSPGYLQAWWLLTIFVVPFGEEVFFRVFLLRCAEPKFGTVWGSLVLSGCFAGLHISHVDSSWLTLGLFVFLLSAVLFYVRVSSGSVWPAILVHMISNSKIVPAALKHLGA